MKGKSLLLSQFGDLLYRVNHPVDKLGSRGQQKDGLTIDGLMRRGDHMSKGIGVT